MTLRRDETDRLQSAIGLRRLAVEAFFRLLPEDCREAANAALDALEEGWIKERGNAVHAHSEWSRNYDLTQAHIIADKAPK